MFGPRLSCFECAVRMEDLELEQEVVVDGTPLRWCRVCLKWRAYRNWWKRCHGLRAERRILGAKEGIGKRGIELADLV